LEWPANRFYWAVLDGSLVRGRIRPARGRSAKRLGYLFESVIPGVPIEDVHAIYRRLKGHQRRFIACGLPSGALDAIDPEAVTLTPGSLPSFIQEDVEPAGLNMLTGQYLPGAIRRLRRRWLTHIGVVLIVCAAALFAGLERRVQAVRDQLDDVIAARSLVLEQVLGAQTSATASSQPLDLRLTAELRRLEQTRNADVSLTEVADSSAVLNDLLTLWPSEVHALTESISVTPTSITVRAAVATMADAQEFADAFAGLGGWRLRQPQSESRRGHLDVILRFEPAVQEARP
jgi:hypothetical protein